MIFQYSGGSMFRRFSFAIVMLMIVGTSLISMPTHAAVLQTVDSNALFEAGQKLEEFTSQFYLGFWVGIGGVALSTIGTLSGGQTGATLILVGSLTQLAGSFITFFAYGKIAEAGNQLRKASGRSPM